MLAVRGGPLDRGHEASPPLAFEPYDEKWNLRLDGSTGGMTCFFSATDHTEVHEPDGSTYPVVMSWIAQNLAAP